MSSPDEVSVWGTGFGPDGGERAGVGPVGPTVPRGRDPGPEPGEPRNGEGGGGFPDPEGFQSEREMLEAGGPVLWGREGRPGSPADDTRDLLDLAEESAAAILRQLADWDVPDVRRHPSQESCAAFEVSAVWAGLEAGPGGRGAPAQSCGEAPPAPAGPLHLGGPEAGRAWGNPKRGPKRRLNVAADRQRLPEEGLAWLLSDPESSDEFSETELITSKHTGAGKKSVARRARESEAVAGEDKDPNRDPAAKGQLPTHRPGTSFPRMHRGKACSEDLNTRGPQDPGNSEPLALNQGEVVPRVPVPSGDREPLDHPPRPERQQQPLGTPGCPRCLMLQREIDDLKEKLAAMQYLADKFQSL